jgi:sialic acid synthase
VNVVYPFAPLALLCCTAEYPCEPRDMQLRTIETYRERFPTIVVGISDHQSGIAMGPVAFALGARIHEKHFTLSRTMKGSDQAFSLEPVGLRKLCRDLERVREALGDGVKRRLPGEVAPLVKMGRSREGLEAEVSHV